MPQLEILVMEVAIIEWKHKDHQKKAGIDGRNSKPMDIKVSPDDKNVVWWQRSRYQWAFSWMQKHWEIKRQFCAVGQASMGLDLSKDGSMLYTADGSDGHSVSSWYVKQERGRNDIKVGSSHGVLL